MSREPSAELVAEWDEWLAELSEDLTEATHTGAIAERLPLKYLHKAARLRVLCDDCGGKGTGFLIAAIVNDRRPLLIARESAGRFVPSVFLDGALWGDIVYCRRRQWALHTDDLAEALKEEVGVVRLSHAMKT